MTSVVDEQVLRSHRLGRFIEQDGAMIAETAAKLSKVTDPTVREMIANTLRLQAFEEIFEVVAAPTCSITAAQIADLTRRVFAAARTRLDGVFPAEMLDQALTLADAK